MFTRYYKQALLAFGWVMLVFSCKPVQPPPAAQSDFHFSLLDAAETGISFRNDVPYSDTFNCYLFRNFYNGGGVGLGDVNNDGLLDVFLCGNMAPNRLYLNLGNWKFRDVTAESNMGLSTTWTAGVAMVDVNGDGQLDIYTCKSGPPGGADRHNQLFINTIDASGVPHFKEVSKDWHLDNTGLSTHAAFFDYDHDGDLDCYLLNNSLRSVGGYDYRLGQRNTPDAAGGNKLLRNDGPPSEVGKGGFTDVTQAAGIYSSAIGFGLGVTVGDYDRDGWQDLFVSNDFFERDYLYHNEGNGTFKEVLTDLMPEISKGSMGADMADLNNDGYPEIFVTEMTPPDEQRYKTKAAFDNWDTYKMMQQTGYHNQFGRNVLQLNQAYYNKKASLGSAPAQKGRAGAVAFAEIGRQAGVHFTDWSWGALLADFDNDGWKDIFVANGIGKDLLDQDYINFYADPTAIREILQNNPGQGIKTLIDKMPSQPVANYFFHQKAAATSGGIPSFESKADKVGLATPSFSNGSAYGDLDNDGDLDLIVNNVNMPCFVYRNEVSKKDHNWLKIKLIGEGNNTLALGATVSVSLPNSTNAQYFEVAPMRGFESCTDPRPHFGLGKDTLVDVLVTFLSGKSVQLNAVRANQMIQVKESDAGLRTANPSVPVAPYFKVAMEGKNLDKNVQQFSDFDREPLLFRMFSADSPAMAVADVNGDGLEDFYVGGIAGEAGQLYLQNNKETFQITQQPGFQKDKKSEDTAACFFDADGDSDLDLYVGSGSNEFSQGEAALQDRLYLNDSKGHFTKSPTSLPTGKPFATACVCPNDIDGDGDIDLFVGMRLVPGHYGQAPQSFVLKNEGGARFRPALQEYPTLAKLGMVTDAAWIDVDGDQDADLVVAGDWEPVRLFRNEKGQLSTPTEIAPAGWWNCLSVGDLDKNGTPDLVLGNHGLNARFRADQQTPLSLWVSDFDGNGRDESILCQYNSNQSFPIVQRNDLVKQLPALKKQLLQSSAYAGKSMEAIFTPQQLKTAVQKNATYLQSAVLLNDGKGLFRLLALPEMAQISPIYAIAIADFTGDDKPDLLLGGNHSQCKPEVGQNLASRGIILAGLGNGSFEYIPQDRSGLQIAGSIRDFITINSANKHFVGVSRADAPFILFSY